MTPQFAQIVDPIFLEVFSTLERIDAGQPVSESLLRRNLDTLFAHGDSSLGLHNNAWRLGKYALVAWIDEMLIRGQDWEGKAAWSNAPLEQHLFRSANAYDVYYLRAREAVSAAEADDAVEMYFVCVLLGYQGLYDRETGVKRIQDLEGKLPLTAASWVEEFGNYVEQIRRQRAESVERRNDRQITTATPWWSRTLLLCPWVLTAILVGLNVICVLWR